MTAINTITENDVGRAASFIRETVKNAGSKGVILGLSGGLDSAVVAKLSVMALGKQNVMAVSMPMSNTTDAGTAKSFAESLGIEFDVIPIGEIVDSVSEKISGNDTPLDIGNLAARCRMSILYNIARKKEYLVIGTSNKSEIMVGYFTKYGDGACDLMPLSDYFKTQVREMAALISIPEEIISKPPSAGFWNGQTDEEDMGMTYEVLDSILNLIESKMPADRICDITKYSPQVVTKVINSVKASEHKRHLPARP